MYGAILGDIIGSPFEFDRGNKSKKFELFSPGAEFTDDTVMTIAVCEGLLDECLDCEPEVQKSQLIHSLKKWGRKYLYAGYGARFRWWLLLENPEAYAATAMVPLCVCHQLPGCMIRWSVFARWLV